MSARARAYGAGWYRLRIGKAPATKKQAAPSTKGPMRRVIGLGLVLLSACAPRTPALPSAPASAAQPLPEIALKYRVRDVVTSGRGWTAIGGCYDPYYPFFLPSEESAAVVAARTALAQTDPAGLQVLQQTVGVTRPWATLETTGTLTLAHELHQLGMISLTPGAAGDYTFLVVVQDPPTTTVRLAGTITPYGALAVTDQAPWSMTCPVCLAATTQIATPMGLVSITELAIGDLVWTHTAAGERVAAPVRQLSRTAAPPTHRLVQVTLADGRQVAASAGHPISTGEPLGALAVGDMLDGVLVQAQREIPYGAGWTYDLLPAGDTGWYWADGVLLSSTLHP